MLIQGSLGKSHPPGMQASQAESAETFPRASEYFRVLSIHKARISLEHLETTFWNILDISGPACLYFWIHLGDDNLSMTRKTFKYIYICIYNYIYTFHFGIAEALLSRGSWPALFCDSKYWTWVKSEWARTSRNGKLLWNRQQFLHCNNSLLCWTVKSNWLLHKFWGPWHEICDCQQAKL